MATIYSSMGVFEILLITLGVTLLAWLCQFHWRRRRMYQLAAKLDGPMPIPIFGNALAFAGDPNDFLDIVSKVIYSYQSPARLWTGPILSVGITEPEQLEIIMNNPKCFQKADVYKFASPLLGQGLVLAPVPRWKKHRKLIMPTFNQKVLDQFVEVFTEKSERLVERLKKHTGKTIDVFEYISACTIEIFCETAMGVKVDAQTQRCEYTYWIDRIMEIVIIKLSRLWYHIDFIFKLSPTGKEGYHLIDLIQGFTAKVVREKREAWQKKLKENEEHPEILDMEEPTKLKPFLQLLIELSEAGAHLTDVELREEVDTFMIAGTDTSAVTNSFVMIMLGMHPECQEKVYEEVMDVLGPDKPVESSDLGRLQYLERVIKETLRFFPVFPYVARAVPEDVDLNGVVIPAGCTAALCLYNVQRNPKYWPNPLKFDPDRFLPEEVAKRHTYAYVPFSGGPRNCVGIRYAMMGMKTLLATVVRKYKISTEYKNVEDIKLVMALKLKPLHGHKVALELR